VKALVIDATRKSVSAVTGRFECPDMDEASIRDDAVHEAGHMRVEPILFEDAVGGRVRRLGCRDRGATAKKSQYEPMQW
jgi:hypothetical protein